MAQPTPELLELTRVEVRRRGQEPRFVVGGIGQAEWNGGSQFFDNDTVLAVTDAGFLLFNPQRKGFGGRRVEVALSGQFDFVDITNARAASDEDGTPKLIRFLAHEAVETTFMDLWADPQWDAMVSFCARQLDGGGDGQAEEEASPKTASWERIEEHIQATYHSAEVHDGFMKMVFDLGEGRSQGLLLRRQTLGDDDEWVSVESAVGKVGDFTLNDLTQAIEGRVVGGIACAGDVVLFRDTLRVEGLDLEVLDEVMVLVCVTADQLEQTLVGGDTY